MSKLGRSIARWRHDVGGNVAWIYALSLVPLTLAAGAGLDYITAVDAKTTLQNAIDAATLAGAGAGNSQSVASSVFAAEPLAKFGKVDAPSFSSSGDNSFTGKASAKVSASFLGLIGIDSITVSVTATAKTGAGGAVCILVANKSASQALLLNGGAKIEAASCEVHVASGANPAAIFNSGTTLNAAKICIAGSSIIDNGGIHPNLAKSCTTAADPFAGLLPVPSSATCTYSNGNWASGAVMSPGVYCGWHSFAGTISFSPGVYVIKNGGWNVNGGTWSGTGVTFYFADTSKIQFNSGVKAILSAPTSGSYAGILMYEPTGLSQSQFILDDSKGHQLTGLLYLPSRQLTMNSGADLSTDQVTVVVDTLIVNSATWQVTPSPTKTIAGSSAGSAYLVK